jgi:hypothetical protein
LAALPSHVAGDGFCVPGDGDVGEEQAVMRLRSRCGVAGSFQIAGKSVTSVRMRVFWISARLAVAAFWAVS